MAVQTCRKCQKEMDFGLKFCPYCGHKVVMTTVLTWLTLIVFLLVLRAVAGWTNNSGESSAQKAVANKVEETNHRLQQERLRAAPLDDNMAFMRFVIADKQATIEDWRQANAHGEAAKYQAPNDAEVSRLSNQVSTLLSQKEKVESIKHSTRAADSAYIACKMHIESRLVAPSTADFQSFREGDVSVWKDHDFMFLANVTVDAQNGFGAKLRNRYECEVYCVSDEGCIVQNAYEVDRY
jgi:hypothetical protein